ncbi:Major Facilitator Superfamily protein [compost metagenome]
MSDTASHLMMALGPLLGGLIATHYDYRHIFWLALVFKLLAVAMVWRIKEPRQRQALRRVH